MKKHFSLFILVFFIIINFQSISAKNPKSYINCIKMEFVYIPAGSFMMGATDNKGNSNEYPLHKVNILKGYYLSKFQVTQSQWKEVMGTNPSFFKGPDLPVERVSYLDVLKFITRLNRKEGGKKYSLPSEAQWAYACKAGTTTRYFFGDSNSANQLDKYGWYKNNSNNITHLVGQKQPNPWGLYDMYK